MLTLVTNITINFLVTKFSSALMVAMFTYLFTYLLTYLPMEQCPSWEGNRSLSSQEVPLILWNPKVHYRIHKFPSPVPILSHLDPVHTPTYHFLKGHLNINLPSTPGSPKWYLSPSFPHQNPAYASPLYNTCYMSRPSHYYRFNRPKFCANIS